MTASTEAERARVLFSPYTGERRHISDVQSDPQGLLIVAPGAELQAARRAPVVPQAAIARIDEALNQLPFNMTSDSFTINNGPQLKNSAGETMFYGKNMVNEKLAVLANALRDARAMLAAAPQPPEAST